uniref:Ubiquitin-like domain-containing protein n=1 Tax=Hanusia phi TaxID=3032 RepID=A0A7S0F3P5_9CRYP
MQIFLRTLEDETLSVEVGDNDGIDNLLELYNASRDGGQRAREDANLRVVFGGVEIKDKTRPLQYYGMLDGSTVFLQGRLLGGGCDGGTTAQQRKFLRQAHKKKKETLRDHSEEMRARWHYCAASGQPLRAPMVTCDLGYIFIKEEVMKQLLSKTLHKDHQHIRKLKDLYNIEVKENPDWDPKKGVENSYETGGQDRFLCPITGRPGNGKNQFVALKTCGHVFCEQALRHLGGDVCVICNAPFSKAKDVVHLTPPPDLLAQKRKALEEARVEEKLAREAAKSSENAGVENGKKRAMNAADASEKKAKIEKLCGAGMKVGEIHASLTNTIAKSANLGTEAHANKAKENQVYASMFKKHNKDAKEYDAAWGQGAMAGVLGGR